MRAVLSSTMNSQAIPLRPAWDRFSLCAALPLCSDSTEGILRDPIHVTFITVYCYNCSILLSVIVVRL